MKTVVLTGTPNTNGHTMEIIKLFKKILPGEIIIYNAYNLNIKPCIDCKYCFKHEGCVLDDDMQKVIDDLIDADNIILASPMYFGMLSGPLLSLVSRLQFSFGREWVQKKESSFKKKNGVLVMTSGKAWLNMFNPCEACANIIFRNLNAKLLDKVYATKTDVISVKDNKEVKQNVKEISERLIKINRVGN